MTALASEHETQATNNKIGAIQTCIILKATFDINLQQTVIK